MRAARERFGPSRESLGLDPAAKVYCHLTVRSFMHGRGAINVKISKARKERSVRVIRPNVGYQESKSPALGGA